MVEDEHLSGKDLIHFKGLSLGEYMNITDWELRTGSLLHKGTVPHLSALNFIPGFMVR